MMETSAKSLDEKFSLRNLLMSLVAFSISMNYPAAELRGIKMNFYLINPDAEHRGILLIKIQKPFLHERSEIFFQIHD